MNEKQQDEIYCPECGKPIKKDFSICPYCKIDLSTKKPDGWDKAADIGKATVGVGKALFQLVFALIGIAVIIFVLYSCWPR